VQQLQIGIQTQHHDLEGEHDPIKAPTASGDWKMFLDLFFDDEDIVDAVDVDIVDPHD